MQRLVFMPILSMTLIFLWVHIFFCIFGILKKSQTAEKSVSVEARSSTCDINNYPSMRQFTLARNVNHLPPSAQFPGQGTLLKAGSENEVEFSLSLDRLLVQKSLLVR